MTKNRSNTKRHLHRLARQRREERPDVDSTFLHKHNDSMRRTLKGVDLDRFEELAGGDREPG